MAPSRDYYQTLGLKEAATTDEIKKAFRRLAKQYHPDRNPNKPQAADRFKEINEAHDVLSDPEKRKKYDQLRRYGAFAGGGGFGGARGPASESAGWEICFHRSSVAAAPTHARKKKTRSRPPCRCRSASRRWAARCRSHSRSRR